MPNGGSRLMEPMTTLSSVDIHSREARLRPKPMLPNAAKITRMPVRRKKRTITWVDRSSRDRFGNCDKVSKLRHRLAGGVYAKLSQHTGMQTGSVPRGTRGTLVR